MCVRRNFLNSIAVLSAIAVLAACSSNPLEGVFGEGEGKKKSDLPDKDKRISVLALEEQLVPDDRFTDVDIELPPPYANNTWSQPGGDADHTQHNLSGNFEFTKAWSAKIGKGDKKRAPIISPPIVANGKVYTVDSTATVTALDFETGAVVWVKALTPDVSEDRKFWDVLGTNKAKEIGYGGGVAFDIDTVFLSSGFGFMAALDAATGDLKWQYNGSAPFRGAPTARDGRVYGVTNINQFVALDQLTGEVLWTHDSFEEQAQFLSPRSAAATKDVVIAPFTSGELVALRPDNGRQLWTKTIVRSSRRTALSDLNDIAGSPVLDRGIVFAISHANEMAAIDLRSGQTIWDAGIGGLQMPWVSGNYVFVVSVENELICLSREEGDVVWIAQLPKYKNEKKRKKRISWAGPVIADGKLIMASSAGELISVSRQDGTIEQRVKFSKKGAVASPIVANERLIILTVEGELIAYN